MLLHMCCPCTRNLRLQKMGCFFAREYINSWLIEKNGNESVNEKVNRMAFIPEKSALLSTEQRKYC